MRRTVFFLVATLLIGATIGLAQTAWHFGWFAAANKTVGPRPLDAGDSLWTLPRDKRPKLMIDSDDYDFGRAEFGTTQKHAFVIRNTGTYPLALAKLDSSCSCTLASVGEDAIPPGGESRVELEWTMRAGVAVGNQFRQWARLQTNDPDRPELRLTVHGELVDAIAAVPWEVSLGRVARSQAARGQSKLLLYREPDPESEPFTVTNVALPGEMGMKQLDVTTKPLPADDVKREKAFGGFAVEIALRPGLPVGPFQQSFKLRTNLKNVEPVVVVVMADIIEDVHWSGRDYNPRTNVLNLGRASGMDPLSKMVDLLVFGRSDAALTPRVVVTTPTGLSARFGKIESDATRGCRRVPLTVELSGQASPVHLEGPTADKLGMIEVETGHPDVPRLKLLVKAIRE